MAEQVVAAVEVLGALERRVEAREREGGVDRATQTERTVETNTEKRSNKTQ